MQGSEIKGIFFCQEILELSLREIVAIKLCLIVEFIFMIQGKPRINMFCYLLLLSSEFVIALLCLYMLLTLLFVICSVFGNPAGHHHLAFYAPLTAGFLKLQLLASTKRAVTPQLLF